METNDIRAAKIADLRELVDFLDEHPAVPLPFWLTYNHDVWCDDAADLLAKRRELGGKLEKVIGSDRFGFSRMFGAIKLSLLVSREAVCERVATGTRHVEAVEAHDVDEYEYRCPESFLVALGESASTDAMQS